MEQNINLEEDPKELHDWIQNTFTSPGQPKVSYDEYLKSLSRMPDDIVQPNFSHQPKNSRYQTQYFQDFKRRVYLAHYLHVRWDRHGVFQREIPASERILIGGSNNEGPLSLRSDAARALADMRSNARRDGIIINATSAYRSPQYDFGLWDEYFEGYYIRAVRSGVIRDLNYSQSDLEQVLNIVKKGKAHPGFSNHTRGLAIDIAVPNLPYKSNSPNTETLWSRNRIYQWLIDHASTYHFKRITGEPWHWEFHP